MRRIAIALTLVVAALGLKACAADAPSAPKPPTPGGGNGALQIQLFANDANPKAGTCTLIEAIVTLNGNPVPDGSTVNFSSDFGAFSQNGLPLISVVTQNGSAVTALCGPGAGTAKVKATATIGGNTGSATVTIAFQPSSSTLPFVSSCSPSFGAKEGGTILTLNGGRFFGSTSTTRVQFTVNGVTKDGIVQSVSTNQIVVQTPGFPEFQAPQLLAGITLTLGTNQPLPVVLSLPTCFSYGTAGADTPTISSVLPSSGTKEGHTRVTIVGSGFSSSGVQVFFGAAEATVVSVTFSQVVVLSPTALAAGGGTTVAQDVDVTVKNVASGLTSAAATYTYTSPMLITSANNLTQRNDQPFTSVTIFGQGFQAPLAVTLAGVPAFVQSVTATEVVVVPGTPTSCGTISGQIVVTDITTGETATSTAVFTYILSMSITAVEPNVGQAGISVTITGVGFPTRLADADVKFGTKSAIITSFGNGVIAVTVPPGTVTTPPVCIPPNVPPNPQTTEIVNITVSDRATTCFASATFTYQLPCVPPPTPAP
jgi:hypothetical protein